ncbi:GTP-binding protein [Roseovarius aestuarii]|nr:GTP-binding protein [Roseovarius aestuarii]
MVCDPRGTAIPLVTVGGYLGAGKTTLINQILSHSGGRRYVVFVNDFGAINIDLQLVESIDEDRISFTNGCVCCTLNDEFVVSVTRLAQSGAPLDGILIEASGVADPRALEASLRALEAAGHARFETALYVMDADQFGGLDYIDTETIIDHAVASDLVLINKADLVTTAQIETIMDTLKVAAPYTHLMPTTHCGVPLEILFGQFGAPRQRKATITPSQHSTFFRWDAQRDGLVDREAFRAFAQILQSQFFRAKGLVRFRDAPEDVYALNAVGQRAVITRIPRAKAAGPALQLVGINPQPISDMARIDRALESLCAT